MERQKHELRREIMSPKTILPPDRPGVGLDPAQRRSAKRANFKLKEQHALKSNQTMLLKKSIP